MPFSTLRSRSAAALTRFILSAGGVLAVYYISMLVSRFVDFPVMTSAGVVWVFILRLLALTVGYAGAMRLMAPWLRSDAAPDGRRGIVAGLVAGGLFVTVSPFLSAITPALLGWSLERVQLVEGAFSLGTALVMGALAALAVFFPWLLPRAERAALTGLETLDRQQYNESLPLTGALGRNPVARRERDPVVRERAH